MSQHTSLPIPRMDISSSIKSLDTQNDDIGNINGSIGIAGSRLRQRLYSEDSEEVPWNIAQENLFQKSNQFGSFPQLSPPFLPQHLPCTYCHVPSYSKDSAPFNNMTFFKCRFCADARFTSETSDKKNAGI